MKLRLINKQQESEGVWSFFFEPAEPLGWIAGQSIRLELPRKSWGYDERRFTISSAPHEGHVRITTRLSDSEFKQALNQLDIGAALDGYNVEGDFTWKESDRPKLFLAGGIGITPFRAMLAGRQHASRPLDATLLYASKDQPPVFLEELTAWAQQGLELHLTDKRLGVDALTSLVPGWPGSLVYVSGPEPMVQDLSQQLKAAGLPPGQLKTDLFTGYI